jgi:DnaK suppressor protein
MAQMTKQQLKALARQLDKRYAQLREEVQSTLERSGEQSYIELAGRVRDVGDDSVARLFADIDAAIVDRSIQEVRDIEAARERIASGSFGVCQDCGNEIEYLRLKVYPTAKRCIICQQQREKTYACAATPSL